MKPAMWNLVSLALPAVGLLVGVAVVAGSGGGGGGGVHLADGVGRLLKLVMAMAAPFAAGEAAAIASMVRGERWVGLGMLGAMVNAGGLLLSLYLISRASG